MSGITFNMPGMANPLDSAGAAFATATSCIQNAPANLNGLNINYNVCYDITSEMASSVSQMTSSGLISVKNPVTISAQGGVTMQSVADCATSGAATITDALTGKVKVKQANGTYLQIN